VLDIARVRHSVRRFMAALPGVRPHYAVKANPDRGVLLALAQEAPVSRSPRRASWTCFSRSACRPARFSTATRFAQSRRSNMRQGERRVVRLRLRAGTRQVAKCKPDAKLYLRIETSNEARTGRSVASSGPPPATSTHHRGGSALQLDIAGVTFHVGSQCRNPQNWCTAIRSARGVFERLVDSGLRPRLLDLEAAIRSS